MIPKSSDEGQQVDFDSENRADPRPIRSVTLVRISSTEEVEPNDITVEQFGWKAFGLATLPTTWTAPFFVISGECFATSGECQGEVDLQIRVQRAVEAISATGSSLFFIRSSGIDETLDVRGQLESEECAASDVWTCAKRLFQRVSKSAAGLLDTVHLVVQKSVGVSAKGHLSNERRLRYEQRDWLAEFEPLGGDPGRTEPVAVRFWRSGKAVDTTPLDCRARTAVGLVLRRVGAWAMRFACRMHFEWVWDGKHVWIVQADRANAPAGVDPRAVIPRKIPSVKIDALRVFHPATDTDFAAYKKLANARLYGELGYQMPTFFVLNTPETIAALIDGSISDDLRADLAELTRRPFILRTDGSAIPRELQEMLPRSDELRSLDDACSFLKTTFRTAILESDSLSQAGLCLIGHHFIPSVASAWARAEPGNPLVRIESLWGIPEGLYWHSHDTFEVDTGSRDIAPFDRQKLPDYVLRTRPRYKGTFIASDEHGKWVPQLTDAAHDWARSITRTNWIFEIANTTRRIAEHCSEPVSVMWFIDNHRSSTSHAVLPWFHSASPLENGPKAAPRRKRLSAHDVTIRDRADWERLQATVDRGETVERVVMEPVDTELIRNRAFATDLARLAKKSGFIVELSGGVLSHAYYMLGREGCRVECVDLFGAGEETAEFHKLVRDKIPELIRERGEKVDAIALRGDALIVALRQKLVEEAFEALDAASGEELLGEIADVQEVLLALASALDIDSRSLEQERLRKKKKRGGFDAGLMLVKTAAPQSVGRRSTDSALGGADVPPDQNMVIASDPLTLPTRGNYRRPDLRTVEDGTVEKLFAFKTDVVTLDKFEQRLTFEMPVSNAGLNAFVLTVELDRVKGSVDGKIRLQTGPTQLELDLF
jgi:predicted house-cleaning noncanonical NTP pyrophosphatase (MazG superfamily)